MNSLDGAQIQVFVLNSYFDFNDLENPIQRFVDDQVTFEIYYGVERHVTTKVRRNEYTTYDDILGFRSESGAFYSISDYRYLFSPNQENEGYFRLLITTDSRTDQYERQVLTFWDAIGTLGGIFELIEISFGFLVNKYGDRMFYQSAINSINSQRQQQKDKKNRVRSGTQDPKNGNPSYVDEPSGGHSGMPNLRNLVKLKTIKHKNPKKQIYQFS